MPVGLRVVPFVLALCLPTGVQCQRATGTDTASVAAPIPRDHYTPSFRTGREITLSALGAGLLVGSFLLSADDLAVPSQGLDPSEIALPVDRDIIGNQSLDAGDRSDWTRNTAILFPFVLAVATGPSGERWHGFGRRAAVYAQTMVVSGGVVRLGKVMVGRARPFAYLSTEERPDDPTFDVSRERTSRSMPSGHSSTAWTGAAIGMTDHLLRRPRASWLERAGVGFLGGALASATSVLRVQAGQHFPSDVVVGAGIGIATGIAVPLLHRGEQPLPSSNALLQMAGGALAGTLFGFAVAH